MVSSHCACRIAGYCQGLRARCGVDWKRKRNADVCLCAGCMHVSEMGRGRYGCWAGIGCGRLLDLVSYSFSDFRSFFFL